MAQVFVTSEDGRFEIAECANDETAELACKLAGIEPQKMVAFTKFQSDRNRWTEFIPLSLVEDFVEKLNQERGPRRD